MTDGNTLFDGAERDTLLERMSDGYVSLDGDWRITELNEAGRETVRAALDEEDRDADLVGLNVWECIPGSESSVYYERFHEAAERGTAVEFEARFPALQEWFAIQVYPDADGVSVFFTSVTEAKQRASEIESRSAVVREIYEVFADGDADFESKVESLLAVGRQALGTDFGSLSRVDDETYTFEVVDAPAGTIESGDTVDLTWTNCELVVASEERLVLSDVVTEAPELADKPGNEAFDLSCYIGSPVIVDGEVYGTLCFYDRDPKTDPFTEWEAGLVDLMGLWTSYELERQRAEDRLRSTNEDLRRLQEVLAHDLRNPLTVASGYTDLARETGDFEHLESVEATLDRMTIIIDEVLEVSQLHSGSLDPEPVALPEVARAAWEMVPTEDDELHVESDATVAADVSRLQRLLENLLSNAVSHNDEPVRVTVGDLEDGFYVADTGNGMDADVAEDPFAPGVSTASETGLGLAIVAEIASAHGWECTLAESEVGGARFEFAGVSGP